MHDLKFDNPLPKNPSQSAPAENSRVRKDVPSKVSRGTKTATRKSRRKSKTEQARKRQTYRKLDKDSAVTRLDVRVWKWASDPAKKLLRALQFSPERKCRGGQLRVSGTSVDRIALLNRVQKIIDDLKDISYLDALTAERPVARGAGLPISRTSRSSPQNQGPVTSVPAEVGAEEPTVRSERQRVDEAADSVAVDEASVPKASRPDPKETVAKDVKIDPNQTDFGF